MAPGPGPVRHRRSKQPELTVTGLSTKDPAAIREALDLEFAHSLGAVGISLHGFALPDARLSVLGALPLGRSAKLALQRAIKARTGRSRGRPLDSLHVLVGILSAEGGTVARALDLAQVDRGALLAQAREGLAQAA